MSVSIRKEDASRSVLTELEKCPPVFTNKAINNILNTKHNAKVFLNGVVAVF